MPSSIGFRYLSDAERASGGPLVLYFARSSASRPIEHEDIDVVLGALKFDELQMVIRAFFDELQVLMAAAFEGGLRRSRQAFELELDLLNGWQIQAHGFARGRPLALAGVQDFERYLVNKYGIPPRPQASRADVLASTIPRL